MPSAVGGATGGAAVQAVAGPRVKMRLAVLISGQLVRLHDAQFDAIASLPTAHVHLVLSRVWRRDPKPNSPFLPPGAK